MNLTSPSFGDNQAIPTAFAFCAPDPANHVTMSNNRNPAFDWNEIPDGTRSLVLICCDPDVPSKPDDVNQEGREIPADLPRVDFYHWVLVDLPATAGSIAEGEYSNAVTARGKDGPDALGGTRQGLNNYTDWFAGDADGQILTEDIGALIEKRKQAKANRDFATADAVRDELEAAGVSIADGRDGTTWRRA
ncbi:MAG: hypothetical protein IIB77_12055 [Proteobacteria bacterium]|nr:hypothetical protein [Pseudomonadota bacterium]